MTLACPRDAQRLEVAPGGAALGHRCPSCEGALVPQGHFMRSTGHDPRLSLATAAGLASLRNLPEGLCECPNDGATMLMLRYQGIVIDICPGCHAVWLDKGELATIRTVVTRRRLELVLDGRAPSKLGTAVDVAADGVDIAGFLAEAVASIVDIGSP